MKSELEKNVYMPPAGGNEEALVDIKDYIRYFDKIRDTVTANRRPGTIETGKDWDAKFKEAAVPCSTAEPGSRARAYSHAADRQRPSPGDETETRSKIELLKEQIFKANAASYKDQEKIAEAERLCKMKKEAAVEEPDDEVVSESKQSDAKTSSEDACSESDKGVLDASKDVDDKTIDVADDAQTRCEVPNDADDMDSLDTCDFLEFDLKLNNKINEMHEEDLNTEDDGLLDTRRSSLEVPSLEMKDIEKPAADEHPALKDNSRLPRSTEIISDFYNFGSRPAIFKCPELTCVDRVRSKNLYVNCINREYSTSDKEHTTLNISVPLFSRSHLKSESHVFRSPGLQMPGKPSLSPHSSIISEGGVLHYMNVAEGSTSWYIRKDLSSYLGPKSNIISAIGSINNLSDHDFNVFILSDVVTTVFKRSSYVFYNKRIALLKFVGHSLCICSNGRCLDIIMLDDAGVQKIDGARPGFVVDGHVFECSCAAERDEWHSAVDGLIRGKY